MAREGRRPRPKFKQIKNQSEPSDSGLSDGRPPERAPRRGPWIAAGIVSAFAVAAAAWVITGSGTWSTLIAGNSGKPVAAAAFVGSDTCASCHQAEAKLWQASQHKQAMDHATERSVLGDFNDASFDYFGVTSRFFRKDGKFFVETDGPDGKLAVFEVKYTFGLDPVATISDRVSRWAHPGAVDCMGRAAEGQGRPALVPSLSQREHPRTTTSCTGPS